MAALATGGFSTKDASIGFYQSPAIEWVATVSMLLGGLPLVIYVRLARREFAAVAGDLQVRAMLAFLAVTIAVLAVWLMAVKDYEFERAVRAVALSVVSVVTTTGFVTEDYSAWGEFSLVAFLVLMYVGGCTGSTAGGIKIFRFQIAWLRFRVQLRRLTQPHTIVPMVYQGRAIPEDVPGSVTHFCLIYIACTFAIALGLALTGLDLMASLSGAATAVGNVGPGLGPLIGPAGNFASVPETAKWILSFGMLLGRLEIFTLLVLFSPHTWRG
jgi:trk system potassium uptake protein TrkH